MFETEKDLVIEITKNLNDPHCVGFLFGRSSESRVFKEVSLGYGIPDVVIVQYNKMKDCRKEFLNYFDISILELIEKKEKVSIEDIVFLTRSTKNRINQTLSLLQKEQLVIYREGKYFSHQKYADVLEGSIAIEAKLKNWKRALQQAYRYKWFSNKAFVVLPSNNIQPALKGLELFKKYGVGLASIDNTVGLEVHYNPEQNIPYSGTMNKLLNEYLLNDLSSESE